MNNTTKVLIGALVILAAGVLLGYTFSNHGNGTKGIFGAVTVPSVSTTTYGTALNEAALYQWEANVANTLSAARQPLSGVVATSSQLYAQPTLGPIGSATSTASSSVTFTSGGNGIFTLGDIIQLGESTTTSGILVNANIVNSSTLQVVSANVSAGILLPATTTLYVWVTPRATFAAPAASAISTSSAPYNQ